MKNILFFLFVAMCAIPKVNAQPGGYDNEPGTRGALRVRVSDNSPITIELDDRRFKPHGPSLLIGDLPKGRHYLRIFEYGNYGGRHRNLVYEGVVKVHKNKITIAVLDVNTGYLDERFEDAPMQNMQQDNNGQAYNDNRGQQPMEGNNNNYQNMNGNKEQAPPPPPPPAVKQYPPVPSEYSPVTADNISKTEAKVKDKITDTDKLKVLQSSLKKKSFNTDQLSLMMSWLTFEESRLELAKWAYVHTTDKNNFENLERTQFSENNNRYELDSYINSQNQH